MKLIVLLCLIGLSVSQNSVVAVGTTYTRWGRASCPNTEGTQLVYSGITAGTNSQRTGGGANHLCLPQTPHYSTELQYTPQANGFATIDGVKYAGPNIDLTVGRVSHLANVPCAVCHVTSKTSVLMIPAKSTCPTSWTREYHGYLMTERDEGSHRSSFECVDWYQEAVPGSLGVTGYKAFLFHVEAACGSGLPCGVGGYNNHQELNCVVCTK